MVKLKLVNSNLATLKNFISSELLGTNLMRRCFMLFTFFSGAVLALIISNISMFYLLFFITLILFYFQIIIPIRFFYKEKNQTIEFNDQGCTSYMGKFKGSDLILFYEVWGQRLWLELPNGEMIHFIGFSGEELLKMKETIRNTIKELKFQELNLKRKSIIFFLLILMSIILAHVSG